MPRLAKKFSLLIVAERTSPLASVGNWGRLLLARWLRAEAIRAQDRQAEARALLLAVLNDAERHALPQLAQRCHTALGLIAAASGDPIDAEAAFRRAVTMIEALRAPLPAEEFRTAFVADKLTPYAELVRVCLAAKNRTGEALEYVERARSRALLDMLGGALPPRPPTRDPLEAELVARLETLREELNWFYRQMNRPSEGAAARHAAALEALQSAARERETAILEITRQLQQAGVQAGALLRPYVVEPFDLAGLQNDLGEDAALVEYFSIRCPPYCAVRRPPGATPPLFLVPVRATWALVEIDRAGCIRIFRLRGGSVS